MGVESLSSARPIRSQRAKDGASGPASNRSPARTGLLGRFMNHDVLLASAAAVVGAIIAGQAARWLDRRARRRRAQRAVSGERQATSLLEGAGFRVVARQVRGKARVQVDGAWTEKEVRVDFIARRALRRWLVEVKTGAGADPAHEGTRRQLREYAEVFGIRRVLLVDMNEGRIMRVRFPPPKRRGAAALAFGLLAGLALGAALAGPR